MTIEIERPKYDDIQDDSCPAHEALTRCRCVIATSGGAGGKMEAAIPTADGQLCYGVTKQDADADATVELAVKGIVELEAASAITAGARVVNETGTGKIKTASGAVYYCGIARESAVEAGHLISVLWMPGYMPS